MDLDPTCLLGVKILTPPRETSLGLVPGIATPRQLPAGPVGLRAPPTPCIQGPTTLGSGGRMVGGGAGTNGGGAETKNKPGTLGSDSLQIPLGGQCVGGLFPQRHWISREEARGRGGTRVSSLAQQGSNPSLLVGIKGAFVEFFISWKTTGSFCRPAIGPPGAPHRPRRRGARHRRRRGRELRSHAPDPETRDRTSNMIYIHYSTLGFFI